jgi:hypothetical protein
LCIRFLFAYDVFCSAVAGLSRAFHKTRLRFFFAASNGYKACSASCCLGATAAQALLRRTFRVITQHRGEFIAHLKKTLKPSLDRQFVAGIEKALVLRDSCTLFTRFTG